MKICNNKFQAKNKEIFEKKESWRKKCKFVKKNLKIFKKKSSDNQMKTFQGRNLQISGRNR